MKHPRSTADQRDAVELWARLLSDEPLPAFALMRAGGFTWGLLYANLPLPIASRGRYAEY